MIGVGTLVGRLMSLRYRNRMDIVPAQPWLDRAGIDADEYRRQRAGALARFERDHPEVVEVVDFVLAVRER